MAKRTYNRRGRKTAKTPVTSSARRAQRIKGAQTARKTGSKDTVSRGRGVSTKPTGAPRGAQGPANPPQQGPSRRTPTAIGGDTGRRGGPNQPAKPGNKPRFDPRIRTAAKVGTLVNPRSDLPAKAVAAASLVGDAIQALRSKPKPTPKPKKPMANMGSDYKTQEKDLARKAVISNFDQAFAKARREGKKTFTWRGKTYNTRLK